MTLKKDQLDFLKKLCDSFGPSGFEREPARIVKNYVRQFTKDIQADKLGSLFFRKKGAKNAPVILVNGHLDEVGFIVSSINNLGYLTFNPLGGWFDQVLLSQRVRVRTNKGDLFGVIAAKPIHILSPEEHNKVILKEKMFIDIGASNDKEAEAMGVRIGDAIVPDSNLIYIEKPVFKDTQETGKARLAIGKAFDDRVGVFIAAEVLRELAGKKILHPNTYVGAATTMEEVGLRGARTLSYLVKPDICITVEIDIAGDVPGIESHQALCKLGQGPALLTYDASMIPNQPLKEFVIDLAKKKKIPLQLSSMPRGGTDAGAVHQMHAGCPSIVIGVPTRHIHS
ncbi:MAG: M42 family peptidase, partial [Desulfobacteraceae bacterium]